MTGQTAGRNRFQGEVVVVAGASGGVGSVVARRCLEEGADVAALYRTARPSLDELMARGGELGRRVLLCQADLAEPGGSEAALHEVASELGSPDVLVSLLGATAMMERFLEIELQSMDRTIGVELRATLLLLQATISRMRATGKGGRIVLVGSDSGRVGASFEAVSAACRGGLIALAKSLAREFVRDEIHVNVVCPGPIDTDLWSALPDQNELSSRIAPALLRAVPMGRAASAEEVAAAAIFLASPEASFITGQTLSVSGGLTMA